MDRGYNDQHQNQTRGFGTEQDRGEQEIVEFHSEMPRVPDENVEFIADEKLEDEITEEI